MGRDHKLETCEKHLDALSNLEFGVHEVAASRLEYAFTVTNVNYRHTNDEEIMKKIRSDSRCVSLVTVALRRVLQ
jgi:hypothetical protein